jgi:hypothetical protein
MLLPFTSSEEQIIIEEPIACDYSLYNKCTRLCSTHPDIALIILYHVRMLSIASGQSLSKGSHLPRVPTLFIYANIIIFIFIVTLYL